MKKYFIITYGCQMNRSDSERIANLLENIGFQQAQKMDEADLVVVNMCSVRQSAVDRVYGLIPKFKKLKTMPRTETKFLVRGQNSPKESLRLPTGQVKLKTTLTGCILKEDLKKFKKHFDFILSIKSLSLWPKFLRSEKYFYYPNPRDEKFNKEFNAYYLKERAKYSNNFSAFVPIMTGCNNFCTFCVVPYVRGPEISRPAKEVLCEIKNLIKEGFKEIWLLGQNVNSYRDKDINFAKLLRMVNDIEGNFWIRFTSSHPKDFSNELIDTIAGCEKVTEYLNLPVQSGDDEILKKMNRPYTIKKYKSIVKKIREKIPEIALSTDVIVGFPGETKKQFENTLSLFKEIKYDMAYIAKYSKRPQTAASKLKDDISLKEKERRWKILTEILKETAQDQNKKYIGKTVEVLINNKKGNFYFGKTRTYKTIKLQATSYKLQANLVGQFVKVKIIDASPWGLKGKLI